MTETSGREVFTIALTAQINIDPARRSYDAETRARLVELFGAPERWGATTHSFLWSQVDTLVPASPARRRSRCRSRAPTTSSWPPPSTSTALPDGEVPLAFHFTGSVLYRGDDGQLQIVLIPWTLLGATGACRSPRGAR